MLHRQKVLHALEEKRPKFQEYLSDRREQRHALDDWVERFCRQDQASIQAKLETLEEQWPGALPTAELDQSVRLCLDFAPRWSNHQEARRWAMDTIKNRPTLAVDGSQIAPTKDISVPVGAIQIGWFINEHRKDGAFVKDLDFEILAPDELAGEEDDGSENFATETVNQVRFVRECQKLSELMAFYASTPAQQRPLCFFDGSFIISFAGKIRSERAERYIRAITELLDDSNRFGVPMIGFVDSSLSGDVVSLMAKVTDRRQSFSIGDAAMCQALLSGNWGNRTPLFYCARADALSTEGRADFYQDVAFAYINLGSSRPPARVEMPRWLVENGRAEEIFDLIRAECIVGTGYPYAIETADALAVISHPDRQRFYALFEQFVGHEDTVLTQTRKASSKRRRR